MSDDDDDDGDDGEYEIDELGTQRARLELERVFAKHDIPATREGDIFCFGFADLVARVEIVKGKDPEMAHAHMTVSGPPLAAPVLDCWVATGKGPAEAIAEAVHQWVDGPYNAYHDAFAHDHEPTYVLEREEVTLHVFEAPVQGYRGRPEDFEAIVSLGVTRALVEHARLTGASRSRAHRLRWVRGKGDAVDVFLDDEPQPDLVERLQSLSFPDVLLARSSAVLMPMEMAKQRTPANLSLGATQELLRRAKSIVDVDSAEVVLGAMQHGIERMPGDVRIPELCLRWSQLAASKSIGQFHTPLDAPLSRGLLEAYARMAAGEVMDVGRWLSTSLERGKADDQWTPHAASIAQLFCEVALPPRSDALINLARQIEPDNAVTQTAASSLEAPSAVRSLREAWPDIEVSYAEIGDPDPRRPRSPDAISLWTYRSDRLWDRARGRLALEAAPAVAPPSARAADAVARVAATPYTRETWSSACREVAREIDSIEELLAVMVHPPRIAELAPWDSRWHVMVAAALAIGHINFEPLVRVIDGPVDWTTTAAAIALCDVALRRPDLKPMIAGELSKRTNDQELTPVWYQCYVEPARWLVIRLLDD